MTFVKVWQYLFSGVVAALVLLSAGLWYVQYANRTHPAPWPMLQGDARGSFATRAILPAKKPSVLWSHPLGDDRAIGLWPVIGEGNTVYFAGEDRLVALDAEGKLSWAWNSGTYVSSIALGRHGEVYVQEDDGVIALDSQGRRAWRLALPRARGVAPMIVGQGGVIYAVTEDIYAITDTGQLKWSQSVRGTSWPVEAPEGQIIYADGQGIYALEPSGELAWSRAVESYSEAGVAVGSDQRIYLTGGGYLRVLDTEGALKAESPVTTDAVNLSVGMGFIQRGLTRWSAAPDEVWTAQVDVPTAITYVDADGQVLLFTFDDRGRYDDLILLDSEGKERWRFDELRLGSLPAIGSDGRICFASLAPGEREWALTCIGTNED